MSKTMKKINRKNISTYDVLNPATNYTYITSLSIILLIGKNYNRKENCHLLLITLLQIKRSLNKLKMMSFKIKKILRNSKLLKVNTINFYTFL